MVSDIAPGFLLSCPGQSGTLLLCAACICVPRMCRWKCSIPYNFVITERILIIQKTSGVISSWLHNKMLPSLLTYEDIGMLDQ